MRFRSNFLANFFNFLGDALEDFNPAAFRFLSAVLPYATPIPVAWLTADSASTFLNFGPTVSFIFVFCLEGIGLWFTSLLVDAIVEWIRSWRNWRTLVPVLMFLLAVGSYIYLLVNLNVTLEQAKGDTNPLLSRVITLLCFLPLITGIGNGYGKLKLEQKTNTEKEKVHQEEVDARKEQEKFERELAMQKENNALALQREQIQARKDLELEKIRQKEMESSRKEAERQRKLSESVQNVPKPSESLSETFRNFPKDWRTVETLLNDTQWKYLASLNPVQVREMANIIGVSEKTITNWRSSARTRLGL